MSMRRHEESLRRQYAAPGQIARFRQLDEAFGLGLDLEGTPFLVDVVQAVVALTDRPALFRSGILLLGATGVYPMERDARELAACIEHDRLRDAYQLVIDRFLDAGRMASTRTLVRAAPLQIDVTSVSRETAMTGIPRVVTSLIGEAGDDVALHVWSHGAAGPVTMLADATFEFDPELWSGARSGRWPLREMRRLHRRLRAAAVDSTVAAAVLRVLLVAGAPLFSRLSGGGGPTVGYLFVDGDILIPEVCQPDVVDRLLTWRTVVDSVRIVMFVHDLLPITAPQYFPAGHPEVFLSYLHIVARADIVVTTTSYTADQVKALAGVFGQEAPQTRPIALPVTSRTWAVAETERGFVPQFTCIGSLEPRKNHRAVLKAAIDLQMRGYPVIVNLVGNKAWADGEIREVLAEAHYAGVDVRLIAGATDDTVASLMEASVATIFVSWAEGYGLPVLESLARGVPVIGSDVPPISDFAAYGGMLLVAPHDYLALADAMLGLIDDPSSRERLAATIESDRIPVSTVAWASEVFRTARRSSHPVTAESA